MAEIKTNDMQEIKNPVLENYQQIKPEKGMTVQEAKSSWDRQFSGTENDILIGSSDNLPEKKSDDSDYPRNIITVNESLENDRHPITGVEFERKVVELPSGEKIEGVFPNFESAFDAKLPKELYLASDKAQFKECNRQIAEAIEYDPKLKDSFSSEQLEQIYDGIKDGTAPDGFVWHHDVETGKMQLVDFDTHQHTGHTGGRSIWGGGSNNR